MSCLQLSTTDFCLTQRIPTSPGLWNEDESDYVINGAPLTNMIPPDSTPGGEQVQQSSARGFCTGVRRCLCFSQTLKHRSLAMQDLPELLPVNVVMSPGGARHCIRFSRSLDAVVNNDGKVSMFEHVNVSVEARKSRP